MWPPDMPFQDVLTVFTSILNSDFVSRMIELILALGVVAAVVTLGKQIAN